MLALIRQYLQQSWSLRNWNIHRYYSSLDSKQTDVMTRHSIKIGNYLIRLAWTLRLKLWERPVLTNNIMFNLNKSICRRMAQFHRKQFQCYGRKLYPASGIISLQSVCTFSYEHYKLTTITGQLSFYHEGLMTWGSWKFCSEAFGPKGVDLKRYTNI